MLAVAIRPSHAAAPASCGEQFQLGAEFYATPIPGHPVCVAAGDWNEDGRQDVVVVRQGAGLSILLGRPGFRLTDRQEIPLDIDALWVAARDMDGDGHQDLVVTGGGATVILAGDGRGGFHESERFLVSGRFVTIGDVDGDGMPDIVVASPSFGLTAILHGTGATVAIAAAAYSAVLADFDHDGDLDLAANGTRVWLNDGHAHFSGPTVYANDDCAPGYLVAGDLNGDGKLDLFGATLNSDPLSGACDMLLLGNGDGTFAGARVSDIAQVQHAHPDGPARGDARWGSDPAPAPGRAVPAPEPPHYEVAAPEFVVLADLNGDGKADAVRIGGLRGQEFNGRRSIYGAHMGCAADMDGDGVPDIVVAGYDAVAIHPSRGAGAIAGTWTRYPPSDVVLADLDGDSRRDVLVTAYDDDELVVALTAQDGGFKRVIRSQVPDANIVVADFDGDGRADLLDGYGDLYPGNGDGTFRSPPMPAGSFGIPGDFNEDGHLDLAQATGHAVRLWFGNGDGTFRQGPDLKAEVAWLGVADVDHDGHLDFVASAGGFASVLYGRGDGTIAETVPLPTENRFGAPSVGDFDGDGLLDFILPSLDGAAVYLSRGRTFVRSPYKGAPLGAVIADLDGNGIADLIAGGVWLGHGDGTFEPEDVVFGPGGSVAIDDRNGDGLADLVVAGSYDEEGYENVISVFLNETLRNHSPDVSKAQARLVRSWPPNGEFVDVNLSGITDLDGDPLTITCIGVTQDEPIVGGQGPSGAAHGQVCADASIDASGRARVRLARDGSGNGRVYEIAYSAADPCGATSLGRVRVEVPHDHGKACIDDGQRYNSLSCGLRFAKQETEGDTEPLAVQRLSPGRWSIRYTLAVAADIQLDAFDLLGRRVARLESGRREAGSHEATWTPSRPNGVYFVRLVQGDRALVRRCVALE